MGVKGLVVDKLQEFFGDYVDGLTRENLKMQTFAGTISQENLKLKPAAFESLDIPVVVTSGTLSLFHVEVPWAHLGSSPLTVTIEDVRVVAVPNQVIDPDDIAALIRRRIENKVKEMAKKHAGRRKAAEQASQASSSSGSGSGSDSDGEDGYVRRLGRKIADNLQVTKMPVTCHGVGVCDLDAASAL